MKTPIRQVRRELKAESAERRDAVRHELEAIAAGQITDVVTWDTDDNGAVRAVQVVPSAKLSQRARRAIKKIKVTPGEFGNTVEIEMHDKLSALRVLAKVEGLLDGGDDEDKRPSLVGINLKGPAQIEGGNHAAEGHGLGDAQGDADHQGVSDRGREGS